MRSRRALFTAMPTLWFFALLLAFLAAGSTGRAQSAKKETTEKAKVAPKPQDDGPRVVSKAKDSGRGSQFLVPPGADRYDPSADDWREIPSWQQTSFFGIRARGQFFIYVVDCSGSMIDEDRLMRAKEEVRRSVLRLQQPQRFKVIFYNDQPLAMPGDLPRSADLTSKNQLLAWLRLIEPDGENRPAEAPMSLAAQLSAPMRSSCSPTASFPITAPPRPLARRNPWKTPIHCDRSQQRARRRPASTDRGGERRPVRLEALGRKLTRPARHRGFHERRPSRRS